MVITKPDIFHLSPCIYFDDDTYEEFPKSEINKHPVWYKIITNNKGAVVYYEQYDGYWAKYEYDNNGNQIYYENSDCVIMDKRK